MNTPLSGKEKEAFKKLLKPQQPGKLLDSKEKLSKNTDRTLPIRGQ